MLGEVIIFGMKARIAVGLVVLLLLVAGGMLFYAWKTTPSLVDVYPLQAAQNMPSTTPIRLVFSHPMLLASVTERLSIDPVIPGSFAWDGNTLTFTPDQAWPAGSLVKVRLDAGARSASWLSFSMISSSWSFTTSGAMLAYLWPADGSADIYALVPDNGQIVRFTFGMGVRDFTVSRSGLVIYFSADNSNGGTDLYKLDRTQVLSTTDSSYQVEKVLECGASQCRNPAISKDDRYLAYEYILSDPAGGLGPAQIWMLDLTSQQASPVGLESHETVQPAWSSTGLLAYYDRTSSGYEVTNPITSERSFLSNQTGQPGDWSPDGKYYLAPEIYYYQAPENTERGTSHLLRYQVSDSTSTDISQSIVVEDTEAVYSPDGSSIAFARKFLDVVNWTLGRQLWIMNMDGGNAHPITDEADYNHYDIAWSRDGKMLAYVRFDEVHPANSPELWMIDADGSNPLQLMKGGYSPVWIP
jgi:Tol biopolymer transport system component